jgi:hypothetical protein
MINTKLIIVFVSRMSGVENKNKANIKRRSNDSGEENRKKGRIKVNKINPIREKRKKNLKFQEVQRRWPKMEGVIMLWEKNRMAREKIV